MSTLKTHNLQSPDAGSVNIAMTPNAGMVVTGISTFSDVVGISSNLTVTGISTFTGNINLSSGNLQFGGTNVINSGLALYNLDSIKLADSKELKLGSSDDLKIYHSGTHSFISEVGNGALKIKGDDVRFENASGGEALRIDSNKRLLVNTTTGFAGDNTMVIAGESPSGGAYDLYDGQLLITSTETSGAVNTGGVIQFYGHDGGSSRGFGSIRCLKENGTSGNYNAYMAFLLRVNGGNPTERLRIQSTSQLLHTRTDNTTRYDFEFRNTGGISDGNYGGILWTQGASGATNLAALRIAYASTGQPDIVFATRQSGGNSISDALRIHKNGDLSMPVVGSKIYTNNSAGNLTIQGGATYPGAGIKFNGGGNGGTGVMHFYAGQTTSYQERMTITAAGYVQKPETPSWMLRPSYSSNQTLGGGTHAVGWSSGSGSNASAKGLRLKNVTLSGSGFGSNIHNGQSVGKITVPVAGVYYIWCTIRMENNPNAGNLFLYIDGTSYNVRQHVEMWNHRPYMHGRIEHIVNLNANSYIIWGLNCNGGVVSGINDTVNWCGGHLIG